MIKRFFIQLFCNHEFELVSQDYKRSKEYDDTIPGGIFIDFLEEKRVWECWKCDKKIIETNKYLE